MARTKVLARKQHSVGVAMFRRAAKCKLARDFLASRRRVAERELVWALSDLVAFSLSRDEGAAASEADARDDWLAARLGARELWAAGTELRGLVFRRVRREVTGNKVWRDTVDYFDAEDAAWADAGASAAVQAVAEQAVAEQAVAEQAVQAVAEQAAQAVAEQAVHPSTPEKPERVELVQASTGGVRGADGKQGSLQQLPLHGSKGAPAEDEEAFQAATVRVAYLS